MNVCKMYATSGVFDCCVTSDANDKCETIRMYWQGAFGTGLNIYVYAYDSWMFLFNTKWIFEQLKMLGRK